MLLLSKSLRRKLLATTLALGGFVLLYQATVYDSKGVHKGPVDLMAAVLTHMVEQRITMDARKAKMEEEMMKHMMQHMQMGKESMSQCPMMKGMKNMDDKSVGAHEEHQDKQK